MFLIKLLYLSSLFYFLWSLFPGLACGVLCVTYVGLCQQTEQLIIYTINIPDKENN